MNGNGEAIDGIQQLAMPNPVADMLASLLSEAQAGRISSIAVVAVTPQHSVATPYVGSQAGDMYIGANLLAAKILTQIRTPQKKSPIIRGVMAS